MEIAVISLMTLALGLGGGYVLRMSLAKRNQQDAEAKAEELLRRAKEQSKEEVLRGKEKAQEVISQAQQEDRARREELVLSEKRLAKYESSLDRRNEEMDRERARVEQEKGIIVTEKQRLVETQAQAEAARQEQIIALEKVAGLPQAEAKQVLLTKVEQDMQEVLADRIHRMKETAREEADVEAKKLIALAVERYAGTQVSETTATSVTLTSDDMKGRIIGKEGRNIKHIEELTGCELIIDETPDAIMISSFNPIRRHVCKRAVEKLLKDGRIHPGKIEEVVAEVKKDVSKDIKEAGEAAVYELGIVNVHPKLVQLLGRLKFRSSYGQNVLQHSIEMSHMAGILAAELGADVQIAKYAALFHDIGKAVDHEIEGTHVEIGRNILKKFGVAEEVVHAMECHHEEYEPRTIEAHIINTVDALSAGRPGARRNTYETYIKRVEDLENIALSFEGVKKAYAIYAGREVRVFVQPDLVDDFGASKLAEAIARKIEQELKYPGEVKVNVIREMRVVEIAR